MARTIRTKVYLFNELSKDAQSKAIQHFSDINTDYNWSESTIDEFKGNDEFFDITNVYYRVFWSQGDGAMFEYDRINKDFVNSVIDTLKLPNWKKEVLKKCTYVAANGKQWGHYYHEKSVTHNINIESDNGAQYYPNIERLIELYSGEIEDAIIDKYEDIARELYKTLENEYNYLTSEESIKETIIANEYEFTKEGNRF